MLNKIIVMGRLTRDPELRRTQSGLSVTSFSVACDRDFKSQSGEKETDFIDIVAWRQTAEFVCKYFSKGRMAIVEGRLQIRDWQDNNGNKRRSAEIVADNVYFGDSKRDGDGGGYMAALNMGAKGITGTNTIYPIYDWKTADVWLYLRDQRIEVPEVYLQMYQVGVNRNQLRVSQFFSVDTVPVLVHLGEYDPSLMERVLRREPNAYLAMLYWDSEMFHRTTRKRRELEGEDTKDYRALLKEMLFVRPGDFFNTEHKRKIAKQYRKMFIQMDGMARPRDYKKMYGGLTAGDPKLRTLRAIYQDISCAYADYAKRFRKGGEANG